MRRARRLFCARDHLGVKPFFYAQVGQTVVFSNTLDCVRIHPSVSDRLNDLAIGDFLLFGFNQNSEPQSMPTSSACPRTHRLVVARWILAEALLDAARLTSRSITAEAPTTLSGSGNC